MKKKRYLAIKGQRVERILPALPASDLDAIFAATPVKEVWGVGRRIATQLEEGGIETVLDLMRMDPACARRRWSVVLKRSVREQASVASEVLVFAHTSPHRPGPRFSQSAVVPLRRPTADTAALVQAAVLGLRAIYKPDYALIKAGVMLLDLVPGSLYQGELDLELETNSERARLMATLDALNDKYGQGMVRLTSQGIDNRTRQWGMRQERLTPGYTTAWADMPIAKAV